MRRLRRVDLTEEPDILTVVVAHDVVAIRLLGLGQEVGVRRAVGLGPVADPVGLPGETRGLAPVGLDGPGAVGIPPDIGTSQELGELLADLHGLEDGGLLVEDTVDFDHVGGSVADTPDVVAGAGGGALLVADDGAEGRVLSPLDAHQDEGAAPDADVAPKELGDVGGVVDTHRILLLTRDLVDVDGLVHAG